MSFSFCHDVIVPGRREEYQVCATFLTAMMKDFAMTAVLKGKCALGPFLSILVIECQHKCFCVNLCKVVDKVQIMSKGMFLDLVHCFMD
jgi:hypothetical protein